MLKREITYTLFDEDETEETGVFYFNISEPEIVQYETMFPGGVSGMIQSLIDNKDVGKIFNVMEELILMAVGKKTEDGREFVKNDEIRAKFHQSGAYIALFNEMFESAPKFAEFLVACLPKRFRNQDDVKAALAEAKTT